MRRRGTKPSGNLVTMLCALALTACSQNSSTKPSTNSGSASSAHTPPEACLDMADAVAKAAERCNLGSYQENHDGFISTAAQGDCNNIVGLRDATSLYD